MLIFTILGTSMAESLTLKQMISMMRMLNKHKLWFFALRDLAFFFNRTDKENLQKELEYFVDADLIEHVGEDIYSFRIYQSIPWNAQELLVHALRPYCINYISFEYMLNQYGIISQVPFVMTIATTGKSQWYRSKSYDIEFTHVDHSVHKIFKLTRYTRGILMASPILAVEDLEKENRNVQLINYEEIQEAQEEYENQQTT